MLDLTSGFVTAHGTKLHYYRTGGAKPPLVLLHGITDDGLCWLPVAEAVSAGWDVVMVDLRGHGKSEAPEAGYTLETLAVETAGLIQALGLEKPVLLGHSLGAITALVFASLYPEVPRAILLEDPPPFWRPNSALQRDQLVEWIHANKRKTSADLWAEVRANPAWSEAELEPWVNSKQRYSVKVAKLANPPDLPQLNFPNLFGRIRCPAWLIAADPQRGAASGEEDITQLKAWIPQLRIEHIPGAGHSIHRDQFRRYMEVIQSALDEFQSKRVDPIPPN